MTIAANRPARKAFLDGRNAFRDGRPANFNRHIDWLYGVAWATGWHWQAGELNGLLRDQAEAAGFSAVVCARLGGLP